VKARTPPNTACRLMCCHVPFKGFFRSKIFSHFVGWFAWQHAANANRCPRYSERISQMRIWAISDISWNFTSPPGEYQLAEIAFPCASGLRNTFKTTFLSFISHEKNVQLRVSLPLWLFWGCTQTVHLRPFHRHQIPEAHLWPVARPD